MAVTPDELARQLHAAGVQLAELAEPDREAGQLVIAQASPPRASGAMAAGQRAHVTRSGVTFASTARYWTFVHYGAPRRNLRARPWLAEALDRNRDDVLAVYAKHARTTLDKIG